MGSKSIVIHAIVTAITVALVGSGCAGGPDVLPEVSAASRPGPTAVHVGDLVPPPDPSAPLSSGSFEARITALRATPAVLARIRGLEPVAGEGPSLAHAIVHTSELHAMLLEARDVHLATLIGETVVAGDGGEAPHWERTEQRAIIAGYASAAGGLVDPVVAKAESSVAVTVDAVAVPYSMRSSQHADGRLVYHPWDLDVTLALRGSPGSIPLSATTENGPIHLVDARALEVRTRVSVPVGASLLLATAAPAVGRDRERPVVLVVVTPVPRKLPRPDEIVRFDDEEALRAVVAREPVETPPE